MIGGEAIDDVHVIPQRLLVFESGQSRTHFAFASEAHQIVGAQEQVMRANFARHRQSLHHK